MNIYADLLPATDIDGAREKIAGLPQGTTYRKDHPRRVCLSIVFGEYLSLARRAPRGRSSTTRGSKRKSPTAARSGTEHAGPQQDSRLGTLVPETKPNEASHSNHRVCFYGGVPVEVDREGADRNQKANTQANTTKHSKHDGETHGPTVQFGRRAQRCGFCTEKIGRHRIPADTHANASDANTTRASH